MHNISEKDVYFDLKLYVRIHRIETLRQYEPLPDIPIQFP